MNWLNIDLTVLPRSEAYLDANVAGRGTWFSVICWCCTQENAGRIENCKPWKSSKWQQLCGVTRKEIDKTGALLAWEGDDLIVAHYPHTKERQVRDKRGFGKMGGMSTSPAKQEASRLNGAKHNPSITQAPTQAKTQAEPKLEPKGKEGKGRERKEKEKGTLARASSLDELLAFCQEEGIPASDGEYLWGLWEDNGWKRGQHKIKDWRGAVRTWHKQGWLPSQKPGALTAAQAPPLREPTYWREALKLILSGDHPDSEAICERYDIPALLEQPWPGWGVMPYSTSLGEFVREVMRDNHWPTN